MSLKEVYDLSSMFNTNEADLNKLENDVNELEQQVEKQESRMGSEIEKNQDVIREQYPRVSSDLSRLSGRLEGGSLVLQQLALDLEKEISPEVQSFLTKVKEYIENKNFLLKAIESIESEAGLLETQLQQDLEFAKKDIPAKITKAEKSIEAKKQGLRQQEQCKGELRAEIQKVAELVRQFDERCKAHALTAELLQSQKVELANKHKAEVASNEEAIRTLQDKVAQSDKELKDIDVDKQKLEKKLYDLQVEENSKTQRAENLRLELNDELVAISNLENEYTENLSEEAKRLQEEFEKQAAKLADAKSIIEDKSTEFKNSTAQAITKEQEIQCINASLGGFIESANAFTATIEKHLKEKTAVSDTIHGLERSINEKHPNQPFEEDALLHTRYLTLKFAEDVVINEKKLENVASENHRLEVLTSHVQTQANEVKREIDSLNMEIRRYEQAKGDTKVAAAKVPSSAESDELDNLWTSSQPMVHVEVDQGLLSSKAAAEQQRSIAAAQLHKLQEARSTEEKKAAKEDKIITEQMINEAVSLKVQESEKLLNLLSDHKSAVSKLRKEMLDEDKKFKDAVDRAQDEYKKKEADLLIETNRLTEINVQWIRSHTQKLGQTPTRLAVQWRNPQDANPEQDQDQDQDREQDREQDGSWASAKFYEGGDEGGDDDDEDYHAISHIKRKVVLPRPYYQHRKALEFTPATKETKGAPHNEGDESRPVGNFYRDQGAEDSRDEGDEGDEGSNKSDSDSESELTRAFQRGRDSLKIQTEKRGAIKFKPVPIKFKPLPLVQGSVYDFPEDDWTPGAKQSTERAALPMTKTLTKHHKTTLPPPPPLSQGAPSGPSMRKKVSPRSGGGVNSVTTSGWEDSPENNNLLVGDSCASTAATFSSGAPGNISGRGENSINKSSSSKLKAANKTKSKKH